MLLIPCRLSQLERSSLEAALIAHSSRHRVKHLQLTLRIPPPALLHRRNQLRKRVVKDLLKGPTRYYRGLRCEGEDVPAAPASVRIALYASGLVNFIKRELFPNVRSADSKKSALTLWDSVTAKV